VHVLGELGICLGMLLVLAAVLAIAEPLERFSQSRPRDQTSLAELGAAVAVQPPVAGSDASPANEEEAEPAAA
jgi:hypothetical protein